MKFAIICSLSSAFMSKYIFNFVQVLLKISGLRIILIKDKKNNLEFSDLEYDLIKIDSLDYHLATANPAANEQI